MSIFKGSRYRFGDVYQAQDADLDFNNVHVIRKTTAVRPDGTRPYTTRARDTFESLADREYGDANKWYVLADMNPAIFWPLDLEPGTLIQIPPKSFASQT